MATMPCWNPRKDEVPEQAYTVPFGEASLMPESEHVTVVTIARMVSFAEKAIDRVAKEGITCDPESGSRRRYTAGARGGALQAPERQGWRTRHRRIPLYRVEPAQ